MTGTPPGGFFNGSNPNDGKVPPPDVPRDLMGVDDMVMGVGTSIMSLSMLSLVTSYDVMIDSTHSPIIGSHRYVNIDEGRFLFINFI
jgi:hypothetical protein